MDRNNKLGRSIFIWLLCFFGELEEVSFAGWNCFLVVVVTFIYIDSFNPTMSRSESLKPIEPGVIINDRITS